MQRRGKRSRTGRSQEKVTRWDEPAILGTEQRGVSVWHDGVEGSGCTPTTLFRHVETHSSLGPSAGSGGV